MAKTAIFKTKNKINKRPIAKAEMIKLTEEIVLAIQSTLNQVHAPTQEKEIKFKLSKVFEQFYIKTFL